MKKVTATVIYKDNVIYNLTVNHKGDFTTLVAFNSVSVSHPNSTFQSMYKSILQILKNNNFYVGHYTQYEQRFYDIQFIDLDDTEHKIEKYAYIMEG